MHISGWLNMSINLLLFVALIVVVVHYYRPKKKKEDLEKIEEPKYKMLEDDDVQKK